jgi:hypothetical protein
MDRMQRAFNEAALRLTGKSADLIGNDRPTFDLVLNDLEESYIQKLSAADLASHLAELQRTLSGNDTAAPKPRSRRGRSAVGVTGTDPGESYEDDDQAATKA